MMTPQSEVANRMSDFDPATGQFLVAGQNAGSSAGIKMDWTALEPRIGAAWKPFGSSNTVVRGGYAIFHDSSWNQGAQGLWQNPPYLWGVVCTAGANMSQGFQYFTSPPRLRPISQGTILAQDTNFKQGRIQQFNVNVEQEIPGQIVLTAGYAGSRSSHILEFGNNINVGSPSACGTVSGYTLGCGPDGAAFGIAVSAHSRFRTSRTFLTPGGRTTIRCRSKPRPRARDTAFTRSSDILIRDRMTPGFIGRSGKHNRRQLLSPPGIGKPWIGDFRRST